MGIHWLDARLDSNAGLDGDARLDGDAGTEDAGIDGDDIPIRGTCTGEGGIHVAIVVTDLGGIAVAKMQVDTMELTWNGKHN